MTENVGKTDQVFRVIIGLVLLLPFTTSLTIFDNINAVYGAVAIGAVLLLTFMFRVSPLYRVLGIKTCKV
jgi:hypothetical protein